MVDIHYPEHPYIVTKKNQDSVDTYDRSPAM
jgi:hypothetical protein